MSEVGGGRQLDLSAEAVVHQYAKDGTDLVRRLRQSGDFSVEDATASFAELFRSLTVGIPAYQEGRGPGGSEPQYHFDVSFARANAGFVGHIQMCYRKPDGTEIRISTNNGLQFGDADSGNALTDADCLIFRFFLSEQLLADHGT